MKGRLALELIEVAWIMFTLNEIVQGRFLENEEMYTFF